MHFATCSRQLICPCGLRRLGGENWAHLPSLQESCGPGESSTTETAADLADRPPTPGARPFALPLIASRAAVQMKRASADEQAMSDGRMDSKTRALIDKKRQSDAVALVNALTKKHEAVPMKICVMVRVRRVFNIDAEQEKFDAMIHVITCWMCEGDAQQDRVQDDNPVHDNGKKFVYDADPDLAFYEPDFRPRIAIRDLAAGTNTLDGQKSESYFYRTYVPPQLSGRKFGKTLVTWEVERLIEVGSSFDLLHYPVDVQVCGPVTHLSARDGIC